MKAVMNLIRALLLCLSFAASLGNRATWAEPATVRDLVIYGPTSAGIAAAVQAKRMGLSVIVVGPDQHLGGLSAGGLGWTDSGNKAVIGGVALDFYKRVYDYYDKPSTWRWQERTAYGNRGQGTPAMDGDGRAMWVFEPHIAEQVFEDLVRDHAITVHRDEWLDRSGVGVIRKAGRITAIKMLSGREYAGKMFIDATYEGDLMAAAGVSYTIGREANSVYGETLNGVQIERARSHQFTNDISGYKVPGDPTSGLLPRVHAGSPGMQGAGDHRVQAYNFRMCLTRVPENRVPFPRPEGYDPDQYELLLRDLLAGSRHIQGKFDMLPNLKTDTNNHGSFSTDNIGMNYDYPDASYERRQEIIAEHRRYQQGYCYFLANDPRVPEDVRSWYRAWGLAKDEFTDNGHWPHQIYVREARRMVGDLVVTENHLRRTLPTERSIGMGSYNMDSHNVQRYIDKDGFVRNEGDIQVNPGGPYPIDYGAILPKKAECENLLVVCAVSSSHIAYGSIRMEPVFMILGQSATTAAAQALEAGLAVQDVPYDSLAARLTADGQVLDYAGGRGRSDKGIAADGIKGIVVDDEQTQRSGTWGVSTAIGPFVERGYRHDGNDSKGDRTISFTTPVSPGRYELRLAYTANPNRASNVPVTIEHAGGVSTKTINQRNPPAIDGLYVSLGTYTFTNSGTVHITNTDTDGYVIADAVVFLPVE
ncbi:MAG: Xanthan lyase precursor [Planctomycetota bacterium]